MTAHGHGTATQRSLRIICGTALQQYVEARKKIGSYMRPFGLQVGGNGGIEEVDRQHV